VIGQIKTAMLNEHIIFPLVTIEEDEDGEKRKKKDETWVRLQSVKG